MPALSTPPPRFPAETTTEAAARLLKIARDLTFVADDYEDRGRAFRDRAQEYVAHAARLRGAK